MSKPKYAVLFDIDGTLLLTAGAGQQAFAAAFAELFGVAALSDSVPFAGRSDRAIALDLMDAHGIEPSAEHWHQFVDSYLEHLGTTLSQCQGQIMPGVSELLEALQTMGHVLTGLLTGNLRSGATQKLTRYGLADHFSYGGFGDLWTDRNAIAQEAFEQARFHAHGDLAGVMVIGDTIHDVRCARSIGACAVAVPTGNTTAAQLQAHSPDILVTDLTDSRPLLDIIGG